MTALIAGLVVGVFALPPSFVKPAPALVYTPGATGPPRLGRAARWRRR